MLVFLAHLNMGYSTNHEPSMASLVKKAWKAKSLKMKRVVTSSQVAPPKKAVEVIRRQEKPTISPLLSRRMGMRILMTIKIPARRPFPPPLVWEHMESR